MLQWRRLLKMIRGHVTGGPRLHHLGTRVRRILILPAFLTLLWLWSVPAAAAYPGQVAIPQTHLTQKTAFGNILRVPGDFSTIQGAVDAAKSGDLVLIASGEYHE